MFNLSARQLILELSMKLAASISLGYFAIRTWNAYSLQNNLTFLLIFIVELITIGLVIISKPTKTRDFSIIPVLATVLGTFYFFLIALDNTNTQLISESVSSVIMIFGILWQLYAKIYLGRNFGLLPACRSVVDTGPYRIVRHPIYLGYFITHIGFLLNNFSVWNLQVLTALYVLLFCRIYYEERILSQNTQYQEYKKRTKYRFIPFLI